MVSQPQPGEILSGRLDILSAWIEGQMAYADLPGLSIGIVHDQELIWAKGFGVADREKKTPATPQTLYRIASNTKVFTAMAIMQLRDAGKLGLDDPVQKHLPWFKLRKFYPGARPITIRHLLTHTAGLPREATGVYFADGNFPTLEQVQEGLAKQDAVLLPETKWKYSNLGLGLAGAIVATVSGERYEDYVRRHVLEPLGMTQTLVEAPDPKNPRLATGYGRRLPPGRREPNMFTDMKGIAGAGNMSSTVEDMARFCMLQFRSGPAGGAQILSGDTLKEMQRVHWMHDWKIGWGLGFKVIRQNERTYFAHGGWVSGYRTQFQCDPETKMAAVVLTNADDGNPDYYIEGVFKWVAPHINPAAVREMKSKSAEIPAQFRPYIGRYRDSWADMQVLSIEGRLIAIHPSLADLFPFLYRLEPIGEHRFRIDVDDIAGPRGEIMHFELDSSGACNVIHTSARQLRRVNNW
ncbi:MAG TPA: serine hydrolase domain-containing protein [Planctomycetota bacterium]|nr:serine hydrolase domain-containing protein [Planctomycetota bacterium]